MIVGSQVFFYSGTGLDNHHDAVWRREEDLTHGEILASPFLAWESTTQRAKGLPQHHLNLCMGAELGNEAELSASKVHDSSFSSKHHA